MSSKDGPQITSISKQLAARMPTEGIPEDGVASAIRSTLYAARDKGILEPLTHTIERQADGDEEVRALLDELR